MADDLKKLEAEVKRILDRCCTNILAWNELDAGNRHMNVQQELQEAHRKITRAIRLRWAGPERGGA